jgi:hypothetical protein
MSTFVYFILFVTVVVLVALLIEAGGPPSAP